MERRRRDESSVKTVLASILVLALFVILPYGVRSDGSRGTVRDAECGSMTQAGISADTSHMLWQAAYIGSETSAKTVFSQSAKNLPKVSVFVEILMLAAFSFCICQKRVFLSYIQFYVFLLACFLCKFFIRLKKDGKKRIPAF